MSKYIGYIVIMPRYQDKGLLERVKKALAARAAKILKGTAKQLCFECNLYYKGSALQPFQCPMCGRALAIPLTAAQIEATANEIVDGFTRCWTDVGVRTNPDNHDEVIVCAGGRRWCSSPIEGAGYRMFRRLEQLGLFKAFKIR